MWILCTNKRCTLFGLPLKSIALQRQSTCRCGDVVINHCASPFAYLWLSRISPYLPRADDRVNADDPLGNACSHIELHESNVHMVSNRQQ